MSRLEQYAESIASSRVRLLVAQDGLAKLPPVAAVPSATIQKRFPWWAHDDAENRATFERSYRKGWQGAASIELRNPSLVTPEITNGVL